MHFSLYFVRRVWGRGGDGETAAVNRKKKTKTREEEKDKGDNS